MGYRNRKKQVGNGVAQQGNNQQGWNVGAPELSEVGPSKAEGQQGSKQNACCANLNGREGDQGVLH
ncbi:MAG: hypothetical protein EBZ21_03420 [Flavobacteriia bacterium]|jgi:hypothetical protein|nr:hypothetical protein [Flavobacteriia bacterium]NDA28240.1 hypothetical protein [Flavobacteriia bacterium]NDD19100.1 hypothetical protein [Flavobacteriia bacterium]NDD79351.1 hypothetical protein [Flavobacteriia bacterium]